MDSDELKSLINEEVAKAMQRVSAGVARFAKGYDGLSSEIGVSVSTIKNWERMGRLDGTYKQVNRVKIFDVNKVYAVL